MESTEERKQSFFAKKKILWDIADAGPIIRRYFVMNFFDGVLTCLGIVLGFFTTNLEVEKDIIVTTCLLTAIAIGISGLTGSHLAESTERKLNVLQMKRELGLLDADGVEKTEASRKPKFSERDIKRALGRFSEAPYISSKTGPSAKDALKTMYNQPSTGPAEDEYRLKKEKEQQKKQKEKLEKEEKEKRKAKKQKAKADRKILKAKKKPIYEEAQHFASFVAAMVDGLSPFLGVIIVIIPFMATSRATMDVPQYVWCFIITGVVLFALGAYLASLSRESKIKFGLIMVASALFTSMLSLLLQRNSTNCFVIA